MRQAPADWFRHPKQHHRPRGEKFAQVFLREHGKHGIEAPLNFVGTKPGERADDRAGVSVRHRRLPAWGVP